VHLDRYIYESQFILDGSAHRVVERLKASPYAAIEDGAYYLNLEGFGVHGRDTRFFFTRKDGTTLYTTRDLAYHLDKSNGRMRSSTFWGRTKSWGRSSSPAP